MGLIIKVECLETSGLSITLQNTDNGRTRLLTTASYSRVGYIIDEAVNLADLFSCTIEYWAPNYRGVQYIVPDFQVFSHEVGKRFG